MTMMDLQSASALGLQVCSASNGGYDSYAVPGSRVDGDYVSRVELLFELCLGDQVKFSLTSMVVIEYPSVMFLIGEKSLYGDKNDYSRNTQDSSCSPSHEVRWWSWWHMRVGMMARGTPLRRRIAC